MSQNKHLPEILAYSAILILGTLLLMGLDAFEALYVFSRAHESWNLDEIVLIIPVGAVCLALFAYNRSSRLRSKALELKQARNDLAEVHDQLVSMTRTREEFIAISCHELKSPLSGIVHSLDLLNLANNERERKEGLDYAKSAAKGLTAIIDGVLEFSRLSNDKQNNLNEFSPHGLLHSVQTLAQLQAETSGLELRTALEDNVPPAVVGHEAGLRLAILNLLGNAIKFTKSGSVLVTMSYGHENHPGKLLVAVADTGIGIPQDKLEFIFEPYQKVEMGEKTGVGLGLAIVNRLVEAMGGTISVSSIVGQGTTFTLEIPVKLPGDS